ncbi:MAG: iron chelate uptake ABC transporter family permease subunit [Bacteroidota bacterium]
MFLIICDTIARTIISPNELPIGVITGIFGGIAFILILSRSQSSLKLS